MVTICSIVLATSLTINPALEPKEENCYKIPQLVKEPTPWYKKHRKKVYQIDEDTTLTFSVSRKQLIVYKKTW